MLPNLTIIISVYCCVRLMEMMRSSSVPKLKVVWALVCVVAIAVIGFFCFDTVRRGAGDAAVLSGRAPALSGGNRTVRDLFSNVHPALPGESHGRQ